MKPALTATAALALLLPAAAGATGGVVPASELPGPLQKVGFEQRLGEPVPLDLAFRDADGEPVELAALTAGRPAILVPVYYDCPMLCGMVLNGLTTTLRAMKLDAGRDFEVVVFSIDPAETTAMAAARKAATLERYDRPGAADGLHFLTGEAEAIAALTQAIGFRYDYDESSGEFAHAAGLVLLTPEGQVARTLYGVEYPPRDLRLGLVEAADGQIGNVVDEILLFCFRYDPTIGRYSAATMNLVRAGGAITVGLLAAFVLLMLRRERRGRKGLAGAEGRA